ncbi:MAG: aerolysin family beta-barrel pore-forming toxin, partial [Clostridia bacterium]|nr:aerolysin family beta-barrel pore-forming toxin [Clostridia bacterium]
MKKTFKSIISILLVMLLTFSCCSVAFAEDIGVFPGQTGPGARPEAQPPVVDENGVVYDAEGNRFGFKFIKAGDVEFRDIFNGLGTMDDMSVREFYKQAVSSKIVPEESASTGSGSLLEFWGNVAAKVFKLAGRGYGWQYDYDASFDKYFGAGVDTKTDYAVDVAAHLSATEPYSKGDLEDDCVRATGLEAYSSLNMVQDVMLEQIIDVCGEKNDAEAFKKVVLDFCIDDEEGFKLFKNTDEQVVLANIISSQYDFTGGCRLFSTFGIAFYDFELTPVIEENLQYISAADNYESIKDAFENNAPGVTYTESDGGTTSISYIKNPTNEPASVSASSSKSTTNSVSNSFSESENYSFSESISANVGIKISDALNVGVNFGFSASQAFGTSYSEDKSLSETVSTSSSASVTLPAYTELGIKQTMSKVEQTVEYDCPVYITYKVAVFGVNGQYFQDSKTGSWSITNYDQGSIFV